ncbi:peptide-methionine (S)-S-oxide reductase [Macrococcus hajekii]|uniref:Peptide methionine sulfoxide reductase MsrA n=1 Tax=Macrococcus hajekii TaxID=198482 RepID=A0A4R6BJN7_9STAP|nr:peptide-methionine (S)-S-oxide reductase [Macrococcus hajekii]TDM01761.1 peptide-methionine (S)-S-oxide reductase [Macrococcus hajekii]GGB07209.1 peptide methionine sulfoxide reductase MsrA [Macrococcus hajekii]
MEIIYLAGGCLWGVQAFIKTIPGVITTEAGRANGRSQTLDGEYDGYAECVKTTFDPERIDVKELMDHLFLIIDPHSMNKQGIDVGEKYRTGVYSDNEDHLKKARDYIAARPDWDRIAVEVMKLTHYIPSAEEHQDHLDKYPDHYCHIPLELMNKYRKEEN